MLTIAEVRATTGEEWYSWPVGSAASAIEEMSAIFADIPGAVEEIAGSITSCDTRLVDQGALLAGVWAPLELEGMVVAQWWAGVIVSPDDETLRSARRYERTVRGRQFDDTTTVFSQFLTSVVVDDMEAVLTIETRAEGDDTVPYLLARAVFFPLWTKDRAVVESVCWSMTLTEEFATAITAMVSCLSLEPSND